MIISGGGVIELIAASESKRRISGRCLVRYSAVKLGFLENIAHFGGSEEEK